MNLRSHQAKKSNSTVLVLWNFQLSASETWSQIASKATNFHPPPGHRAVTVALLGTRLSRMNMLPFWTWNSSKMVSQSDLGALPGNSKAHRPRRKAEYFGGLERPSLFLVEK